MSTGEQQANPSPAAIREEVRKTIHHLKEMAETEPNFDQFCDTVLNRIVKITGAHGALFWQVTGDNVPKLTHQSGRHPNETAREIISHENRQHNNALMEVITKELPMGLTSESFTGPGDPTDPDAQVDESFLMLFTPVYNRTKKCCGTVELLQRGDISPQAQEGYLRFLSQVASLFQQWSEKQAASSSSVATVDQNEPRQTQARQSEVSATTSALSTTSTWSERLEYINETHRSIDQTETCYSIANEARRLLKCDRVSVGKWTGSSCKIVAISSQDRFENRANVVRLLSNVATASVSADSPFWITGSTDGIAPEVAKKINEYLDESHSRTLAVLPLFARPPETPDLEMKSRRNEKTQKLGVIVFEYFDADVLEESIEDDRKLIVGQAELALENARKHGEIFMLPIWKRLGWLQKVLFQDHRAKTITGLVCLSLLMLALIFFPKELKMKIEGVMHPTVRQTVFPQIDKATIREVLIDEREEVTVGQPLLRLVNPDLEIEISSIASEIKSLRAQISNQRSQQALWRGDRQKLQELDMSIQLLNTKMLALADQLELMESKKEFLEIRSPIAGTIITPHPKRRYKNFSVNSSMALLEVADLKGAWQLELKIPEAKVGYVDEAFMESRGEPLDVEFKIGTNPNLNLKGKLPAVASRASPSESGPPEYRAIVKINPDQMEELQKELRSGASVTAKILCGKRSLGFVCFYQVYDYLRTKIFF
ncbi:MAG: efflux RND transporter periplasmic adaptor subunit [Mariniblastus sp.]